MSDNLQKWAGIVYFHQTAFARVASKEIRRPALNDTPAFKLYPEADKVTLPRTAWKLEEARIIPLLQQRRSLRKFASTPIELEELAFLLWASQGITAQTGSHLLRTTPSAGALYPVETYLSVHDVRTLASGLYHFDVRSFQLELLEEGHSNKRLAAAFLDQHFVETAAVNFVWTGVARRCMSKYGDRAGRYLLLDAAHICQNLILAAEAVGCGGCPIAAFYDDEVSRFLGIDGTEELPLYGASIGPRPKE